MDKIDDVFDGIFHALLIELGCTVLFITIAVILIEVFSAL